MPSAPTLKVIDGGRATAGQAPPVPPAIESERLFPILAAAGSRDAFYRVVAVSLILHGTVLLASVGWNFIGEERVAGGSEDMVVIEGVDVILLDKMPSVPAPLAEAREIDESDVAEALPSTDTSAIMGGRRPAEVPVDRVGLASGVPPVAAGETAATMVAPRSGVSIAQGQAVSIDSLSANEVAAQSVSDVSSEVAAEPFEPAEAVTAAAEPLVRADSQASIVSALPADAVPPDAVAEDRALPVDPSRRDREIRAVDAALAKRAQEPSEGPVSASQALRHPDRQLAAEQQAEAIETMRPPAAVLPPDDPVARQANEPAARRAETVDTTAAPPEPGPAPAVADDGSRRPIDDTSRVVAQEIVPDPPVPPKNPLEIVKSKPAKKPSAPAAPKASAAASAASPPARGPTKVNAGAGGKAKDVQGKANLSSYQSKLVAHLRRFRSYPSAARRRRLEGSASVSITINRSGRVTGVSLARSSGHGLLDREAVAMARRASPFPPIPSGLGRSQITIRAPVRFDIR